MGRKLMMLSVAESTSMTMVGNVRRFPVVSFS